MGSLWECNEERRALTNLLMPTMYTRHDTVIRGVRYITFSAFRGEKSIFDKVGELIVGDESLSHLHKEEEEHSVSYGMDKERE